VWSIERAELEAMCKCAAFSQLADSTKPLPHAVKAVDRFPKQGIEISAIEPREYGRSQRNHRERIQKANPIAISVLIPPTMLDFSRRPAADGPISNRT